MRPEFEKLGLKVFEISTASHEGLKELNFALSALVHEMREEVANREQAEEEARVVIKPLETKGRRPRVLTRAAVRLSSRSSAANSAMAKCSSRCVASSRSAGSCRPTSTTTRPWLPG